MLVLATFFFVCIGSIFFLPSSQRGAADGGRGAEDGDGFAFVADGDERGGGGGEVGGKVYKVYKEFRDAGREFMIPPPPLEHLDNPNVRHGVLDRPDPHRVDDRARLMAQVDLDRDVEELRRRQQQDVLQKPRLNPAEPPPSPPRDRDDVVDVGAHQLAPVSPPSGRGGSGGRRKSSSTSSGTRERFPVVQNGEDSDPVARERRNKVKEVSLLSNNYYY